MTFLQTVFKPLCASICVSYSLYPLVYIQEKQYLCASNRRIELNTKIYEQTSFSFMFIAYGFDSVY